MSVLVVLEHRGGKWNRMSFEALEAGRKIGQSLGVPVQAVTLGSGDELATEAAAYDVSKVFALDHTLLAHYTQEAYIAALEQLINAEHPKVVVFPHTYQVRDYAPRLTTRFGQALISDVIDLRGDSAQLTFVRQLFQGKMNADVHATSDPQFVSIQAGAFRSAEPGNAGHTVEKLAVQLDASQIRSKPE